MKKKLFYKILLIIFALSMIFTLVFATIPASEEDPLISESYLTSVFYPKITQYIDDAIKNIKPSGDTANTLNTFKVVSVKKGQTVTCGEGTELILRMGTASIIASQKGGISDVTGAIDLKDKTQMPSNHLLIVPISDGRGFVAGTDALVMIKGSYVIK